MTTKRPIRIVLLCAAAASLACGRDKPSPDIDSLLARDLTLAGASQQTATALGDTATRPQARQPTMSATPSSALPRPARTPTTAQKPVVVAARQQTPAGSPRTSIPATPAPVLPTAPPPDPAPPTAGSTPPVAAPTGIVASGAESSGSARRIGSGAVLTGRTNREICSLANRPGDRLVATLAYEVKGSDGASLPIGTPILVEIARADEKGFEFRLKAVQVNGELIPAEGTVVAEGTPTERRVSQGGDKAKVAGGVIAGAILGKVLGGGAKGAVVGAAAGGAVGAAAAVRNSVVDRCFGAGLSLTITLSSPVVLSP